MPRHRRAAVLPAVLILAALAGCIGEDGAEAPEPDADTATAGTGSAGAGAGAGDPEAGWLQWGLPTTIEEFTVEGAFAPGEANTPARWVAHQAGLGQHVPAPFHLHDISDQVPVDQPVFVFLTLQHDNAESAVWLQGPGPELWVYDARGAGDGMEAVALVVRTGDAPMQVGVWNGDQDPAASVAYSVHVVVHHMADWFPSAIAYGIEVGAADTLELRFGGEGSGSLWAWDGEDTFLGAFTPDEAGVVRLGPGETGAGGELVVFATEDTPRFQARVLGADGPRTVDFRVLEQAIAGQGPWTPESGGDHTWTFDVPVQPLQVGYRYQAPRPAVDVESRLLAPDGSEVVALAAEGISATGTFGFHNTDMGVPMMPPGTYTIEYADAFGKDVEVDGWYVTYGR